MNLNIDEELEELRRYDIYDEDKVQELKTAWEEAGYDPKQSEIFARLSFLYI